MKLSKLFLALLPISAISSSIAQTASNTPVNPTPAAVSAATVVPALVPFSGTAVASDGKPLTGQVGVTFQIFKEEQGGEPLWAETQTVALDATGHYKVQLGATTAAGLPMGLFATGDARWMEVQVAGQKPEPRIMLVSVPYALKAADAETLGGLPASAFELAPLAGAAATTAHTAAVAVPASSSSNVTTSGGTVNTIPLFSTSTDIENSVITQQTINGTTWVNIDTPANNAALDVDGVFSVESTQRNNWPFPFINMTGGLVFHQCCDPAATNIFVGGGAGNLSHFNIGTRNSALGSGALSAIGGRGGPETGDTAVGYWALKGNTNGSENSALGDSAGLTTVQANQNVTGSQNTFLGSYSGPGTATQLTNATAVGANAVVSENDALVLGSIKGVNGATADTKVGIGTDAPVTTLDVEAPVGSVPTIRFGSLKIPAVFAVNGGTFLGGTLAVGEGTKVMSVAHDGIITFAPGQTFPSAGTITGVTTSSPLTGHGTTGSVALGLNTSALENTLNGTYAQLGAANTFPMYQQMLAGLSVTGQLSAGNVTAGESYSGGNAITGANAATSGYSNGGMFTSASPGGAAVVGQNASGGPAGLFIGPVNLEPNFVATSSNPQNSPPLSLRAQGYSSQSGGEPVNQTFQWEAVPVPGTNNTASPSTTLSLLYGSGTDAAPATPAPTGFSINSDGTLNFAGNQSFPITGTGGGTITGITTTSPLTGNGTSGPVALGLNTSALETTLNQNYAQLLAENLFVGYQQVQGGMSVTGALSTGGVTSVVSGSNAVYGQSLATTGTSNGGYFSTTSQAGTGVVGVNSAGGYAGYFQGNAAVTGSTTTAQLGIGGDPPMSHNPHMVFSGYFLGDLNGSGTGLIGGSFTPEDPITITFIDASVQTDGSGCSTPAQVQLSQDVSGTFNLLVTLDIPEDNAFADSGPLTGVNALAGYKIWVTSIGASGCSVGGGSPQNVFVNAHYVMQ